MERNCPTENFIAACVSYFFLAICYCANCSFCYCCVFYGLFRADPYTIDEEVADEQNQLLDPTYSDADRICRDSYVRKLLLQKLQDRQRLPRNHRARGSATSHPAPASWSSSLPPPNGGGSSVAAEELQPVFCYIPIRIRFTLLAQLNPRMSWGVSALKTPSRGKNTNSRAGAGTSGAPGEHYSGIIGHQANPLTVGSDHAIARLVSSTLWLSPEAARTVWLCAKDGAAQCCYHEAHQRHKAYHRCMAQGQMCQAYEHVLVNGLLTQNYRLVTSVNRAYNGISFKFKRLIDCVELCRGVLLSDNTTYDINALGMTIARYIVLGFRYLLMSPQVAHLRGGCAYLLKCVKRVETLLQLAPIEIRCATSCLPTRLGAVSSEELPSVPGKTKVEDKRTPGPKIAVSGSGGAGAEGGDQGGLRMKFKADDVDFEAGLSFGVNKGQQQTSGSGNSRSGNNISNNSSSSAPYEARRVPVFDAPPPLSEAALLAPPPGAPFGGGAGGSAGGGSSIGGATKLGNEGEVMFRRVLAQPARIQEVVALLHELEGMSRALLLTLCEDMCANFPDISAAMCLKTAAAVAKESIPAAVVSLGVDAKLAGSGRSAEFAIPPMVSSLDSLEYVLGKDCKFVLPIMLLKTLVLKLSFLGCPVLYKIMHSPCKTNYFLISGSIESLVAYIHRAETPVNSALSDPDFALHIQSAHSLRQFKIAKSTALSVDSERVSISKHTHYSAQHVLFYIILFFEIVFLLCSAARKFTQGGGN